jgi:hypothetical protein
MTQVPKKWPTVVKMAKHIVFEIFGPNLKVCLKCVATKP